jgi:SAM-dependent methyltransferase
MLEIAMNIDIDVRRDDCGSIDIAFYKRRAQCLRRQAILELTRSIRGLLFAWLRPTVDQFEKQTCPITDVRAYRAARPAAESGRQDLSFNRKAAMGDSISIAPVGRSGVWTGGDPYEAYMGRWSRLVATAFIDWLALPAGFDWLDVGCGTGAVTQAILSRAAPASVMGVEPSDGFLAYARDHTNDQRATFLLGDAQALPFADGAFDAVVAGLVLNFVPNPAKTIAEMKRVLRPAGTAAVYVWDYAAGMQLIRHFWDAAVALNPDARQLDEAQRFPICSWEGLLSLFRDCGFHRAECRILDVPTGFKDVDDYWLPFLGGQGPAPTYCSTLSDDQRAMLRKRINATLPIERDGSVRLTARAFAVRGVSDSRGAARN